MWRYPDGTGHPNTAVSPWLNAPPSVIACGVGWGALQVWWPHFASRVIEMETSSYDLSPVVVLMRHNASQRAVQELQP